MQRTLEEITQYIDHTLLKPYASKEAMQAFCNEAKELKVKMVAINSYYTKFCKELLKDTTIHVGAAISFPLGQTTIAVKAFETIEAIKDGADEIDYVLILLKLKTVILLISRKRWKQLLRFAVRQESLVK